MQYVIMDLEWNNTYARKTSGFINEIIEIGAVKMNEDLDVVDKFSCIIRSQIGRKLRGSVKKLTNLTNDDIMTGMPFTKAFATFRQWIGHEKTIVLTWGDSDIRVLIENFKYLNGLNVIPFLTYYCDLQKYFMKVKPDASVQQAGLITAALAVGIDPETYGHHRALDDSMLTADVFEIVYNREVLNNEILECNKEFYERLLYKAKILKNIDNPLIDKKRLEHYCDTCGTQCSLVSPWKFSCSSFRTVFVCDTCGTAYNVRVRFKKTYDKVEFKKIVTVANDGSDDDEED